MKINTDPKKIERILTRGIEEVIGKEHLKKKLLSGKKLRIKYGVDPTKPDIHLGHTIPLRKLKEFQELGHTIVFILGDFTAQIGDPSGRLKARVPLTAKQASKNAKTYLEQVKKVINIDKTEIQRNSQWYSKMRLKDIMKLAGFFTVARILERDDFTKRMKANIDIHLHEIFYPALQSYDSIAINSDVEIGGTDQKFNMLMGRTLQKRLNKPRQDVIVLPLLVGVDGKLKMSKSFNNYIGVTEAPKEQYGKIMSVPDRLVISYFELLTNLPPELIQRYKRAFQTKRVNPAVLKRKLAFEIVKMYHSGKEAKKAEEEFNKIFKKKKFPSRISKIQIKKKSLDILELLLKTKLASSKSEAKRLILQGGVKINGKVQKNWQEVIQIKKGQVVQVGKRKFVKVI